MDYMLNTLSDFENLKLAAYFDDFKTVDNILKVNKGLINKHDTSGRPPIFWNIETEMFKLFVNHGADLNKKDIHGRNVIQYMFDNCAEACRIEKVMISIERMNRDVCLSPNYRGMTLLHFIREMHNIQGLENNVAITCESCKEFVNILIKKGVSINMKDVFDRTALHVAASCACIESIKLLLNAGVGIDSHESPKIWNNICSASDEDSFKDILLKHGCSINQTGDYGNALHIAVCGGSPKFKTLKWFIQNGIDRHCLDSLGNTVIHSCIRNLAEETERIGTDEDELASIETDNTVCIRYLADNGVDVNKQNRFGFTALHYAVDLINVNLIAVLLELGADINIRAFTGETPMHRAVKENVYLDRFAKVFSDSGLNLTAADNYGSTPLHWAIMYRNTYVLRQPNVLELMDEFVDSKGRTPNDLMLAENVDNVIDSAVFRHRRDTDIHEIDHTYTKRQSLKTMETGDTGDEHVMLQNECSACNLTDPFGICPQLSDVHRHTEYPVKNDILLGTWELHLAEHHTGVRKFVDIVVNANEQGLVQDLVENEQVKSAVRRVMDEFARRMSIEDPLFTCSPVLMGSYREGTKVFRPDEFDYVFRFTHFQEAFNPEELADFPGFLRLKLKPEGKHFTFNSYVDKNGYLDAVQFVPKFYKCCNSVLKDADFMKSTNLYPCNTLSLEAFSIDDIELRWVGPTIKDLRISVDIVPAFGLNGWVPASVDVSHVVLRRLNIHQDLIAVFKTQDEELVDGWSTFLRASVAPLEIAVMDTLPLQVKKGYIIVKALKASNYFPQIRTDDSDPGFVSFLTTYMIKCSFLHEVEMNLTEVIQENSIFYENKTQAVKWAERIIDRITRCIEDKHLPGFFMKNTEFLRNAAMRDIDTDSVSIGLAECACLKKLLELAGQSHIA